MPEIIPEGGLLDDWVVETFKKIGAAAPFGDGRVQLGMAFDGLFLPKDQVVSIYGQARKLGVKTITTHYVRKYFSEYTVIRDMICVILIRRKVTTLLSTL